MTPDPPDRTPNGQRGGSLWRAVFPGASVFRGYRRSWLRGDLLAGLTVAAYLVPQVMAYAKIAGLPPVTGLWAAIPSLVLYVVLGTSRLLSMGPESTTALLTAAALAPFVMGDPARYVALAALLALLVGAVCLVGGFLRLGVLADLLSRPVLVGYLAGIAVTMIVSQLGTLTGVPVEGAGLVSEFRSWIRDLGALNVPTLILGTGTLALLLVLKRLAPRVPAPLAGMLLATAATWLCRRRACASWARFRSALPRSGGPASMVRMCRSSCCPRQASRSSGSPTSS